MIPPMEANSGRRATPAPQRNGEMAALIQQLLELAGGSPTPSSSRR